jgi:hypothetical protein
MARPVDGWSTVAVAPRHYGGNLPVDDVDSLVGVDPTRNGVDQLACANVDRLGRSGSYRGEAGIGRNDPPSPNGTPRHATSRGTPAEQARRL